MKKPSHDDQAHARPGKQIRSREGDEMAASPEKLRARARGGPATGPGWGGPANGPGQIGGPGRTPGVKNGEGKVHKARETLEQAAPLAIQTVIDIANDKADPRALQAALAVLNRIGLHEKSGLEVGGENGNPLITRIERVIVDKAGE